MKQFVRIILVFGLAAVTAAAPALAQQPGSRYDGPPATPTQWPEPTRYIAPDGSDDNAGTSMDAPWQTFEYALAELRPGDVLGVMDGTYTPESTGLLFADCGRHGDQFNGTDEMPITVRAVNERQPVLQSDGLTPAVWISECRNWNVLGLTALGDDAPADSLAAFQYGTEGMEPVFVVVGVHKSNKVALKRILAAHSNRQGYNGNNHVYAIENSSNVIVEESEAYEHHRHAMIAWRTEHVTFRRNYIHTRRHWDSEYLDGWTDSDEAIAYYRGSWGIAENNIIEGRNVGYHAHGGETFALNPGGSWNHFLGNIAIDNLHASRIDARRNPFVQPKPAYGNYFKDFLVVGLQGGLGLWYSTVHDSRAENITVFGGEGTGFSADSRSHPPCESIEIYGGCSHELYNALVWNVDGTGIETSDTYDPWLVAYSNAYGNAEADYAHDEEIGDAEGNIQHSMSVQPTGMGLGPGECIVFVPDESNMSGAGRGGADIGANILYRYVDGKLTDAPLWDPQTGAFPHGAVVEGINDVPGESLFDVHERLNVNTNGCTLPYSRDDR